MPDTLRIVGPFHSMSGYSHMTRAVLRMALLAGYTVQAVESDLRKEYTQHTNGRVHIEEVLPKVHIPLAACQWEELESALTTEIPEDAPTLLIQLPPALSKRGRYTSGPRIGWTMLESDTGHPQWVSGCWGCDSLLVPCRFNAEAFARAGFAHVRVMPIPVDERIWTEDVPPLPVNDRPEFMFLSVFTTTERKQWRLLMQAFTEEFDHETESVGLLVKPSRVPEVQELANWCAGAGARLFVDTAARTDYDMVALYRAADCFVLPSPEGFGLPFIEAGMAGLPSIALDAGGAADVVTEETGYPVPTTMQPIIGHMPNVYPSTHRFPTASLDGLRAVMRRAYEERKDALKEKGQAARMYALANLTPKILAARFRDEIECAIEQHAMTKAARRRPARRSGPQYALAMGAWGDCFCSVGMALKMRDPNRPLHFLYYGQDPATAEFLRIQPFTDGVITLKPADRREFLDIFHRACMARFLHADRWLPAFAERAGVNPADILFTQINQQEDQPIARWHDAALPPGIRCWAHTQQRVWGDYILLHPLSVQSAGRKEHWPHWESALEWLLEETPFTYVLTGTTEMRVTASPRLINLIGRTESMMHVLALCEKAKGVISTCNAVSLWTVMQNIPGLIVANSVFNWPEDYYRRWVMHPPNALLHQYDSLQWFETAAGEWLGQRFAPEENEQPRTVRTAQVVQAATV